MKGSNLAPTPNRAASSTKWWMLALGLLLLANLYRHEPQKASVRAAEGHWRDYFRNGEKPSLKCEHVLADEHMPVGKHYLVDFYNVDRERLDTLESIEAYDSLFSRIRAAGMTILDWSGHRFECGGVTGFVLLAESHVSFHSWPEHNFIALDVYTCGNGKPDLIVEHLEKMFKPGNIDKILVTRGDFAHIVEEQAHVDPNSRKPLPKAGTAPEEVQFQVYQPAIIPATTPQDKGSSMQKVFSMRKGRNKDTVTDDHKILRVADVCVNADMEDDDCIMLRKAAILEDVRSPFQRIEVADTTSFDRCMFLDRVVQFCMFDNNIYTTNIVAPAIEPFVQAVKSGADPISVLIVGGGDGWVANRLFDEYADVVKAVTAVDIDAAVSSITAAFFNPEGATNSFNDTRVTWIYDDAAKWLREKGKTASVEFVIIDCTDHNVGSSGVLYTEQFYKDVHRMLKHGGRVVQQMNTEEEEYVAFLEETENVWLAAGFSNIKKWSVYIPSFGGMAVFWMADA